MKINIYSKHDCEKLIDRIQRTLLAQGYNLKRIQVAPKPFAANDQYIFEGLCAAILTRQATWSSVLTILPTLKSDLFGYNIGKVATLSDMYISSLYSKYRSTVKARFLKEELFFARANAVKFQRIMQNYGSVWSFIQMHLSSQSYDSIGKYYLRPDDRKLRAFFVNGSSEFKLSGVGPGICSEFFNNIGIDEFKPDVHTIRFLNRIGVVNSQSQEASRKVGITIAHTLGKPRKYVDGEMWSFCAEGEGRICTEKNPQCQLCKLKLEEPVLCDWTSCSSQAGNISTPKQKDNKTDNDNERRPAKVSPLAADIETTSPDGGIIVDAQIRDPDHPCPDCIHKKDGKSKGLLRIEIAIEVPQLKRVIGAYPNVYGALAPKKPIIIKLGIGSNEYVGSLHVPPSRMKDLAGLGRNQKKQFLDPWISAGPVKDESGVDFKLAGALNAAGFPVVQWTAQAMSRLGRGRRQVVCLKPVKFRVVRKTWKLITSPDPD